MLQENKKLKINGWLVFALSIVPLWVSVFSTIHVVRFFELTNSHWMSIGLALAFEVGALSALSGLVIIDKVNKNMVWFIFLILTAFQMMGNTYHAFDRLSTNMSGNPYFINNFVDLFGLQDSEMPFVKRLVAIISGAILPIVSLIFLHILINYIMVCLGQKEPISKNKVETKVQSKDPEKPIEITSANSVIDPNEILKTEESIEAINSENIPSTIIEEKMDSKLLEDDKGWDNYSTFEEYFEEKKRKIEAMKEPNIELLQIFYDDGNIKIGEELPKYTDFLSKVDLNKFTAREVNFFLTMCNYLQIFKVSGTTKMALKSYEDAKIIMTNYFTLALEELNKKKP